MQTFGVGFLAIFTLQYPLEKKKKKKHGITIQNRWLNDDKKFLLLIFI